MENRTILVYNVLAKEVASVDAAKAYWGSSGITLLIRNIGTRRR